MNDNPVSVPRTNTLKCRYSIIKIKTCYVFMNNLEGLTALMSFYDHSALAQNSMKNITYKHKNSTKTVKC